MSIETQKPSVPPPPKWLTKAEKLAFRRICDVRNEAGRPVSATETDAIADYCAARSRLADLRKVYRHAARELRESVEDPSSQSAIIAAARAIDTASANARRLGKMIGIGGELR